MSKSAQAHVTVEHPPGRFTQVNSSSFEFPQIGWCHQALLTFPGIAPGAQASYSVTSAGETSAKFAVVPDVRAEGEGGEKFAVFADFGLVNDVTMKDLTASAAAGDFDSVIFAGDHAYNFEDVFSVQGNLFMNLVQSYAATKPMSPAEGNHESCPHCDAVPALPYSGGNFTQYKARFLAVELYAGANSGSNSNRFYSFNRGITHFVVLTAEAYLYARSPVFLANQLAWLKADLAAVDRKLTPWIVVSVHKDWTMEPEAFADFQPLLDAAKVDVLFCGRA